MLENPKENQKTTSKSNLLEFNRVLNMKFNSLTSLKYVFSFILVTICMNGYQCCADKPVVRIQQGKLKGAVLTSVRSGREYFGFMGIPYAKPPLGSLRFKAPQPMGPWTGVRDATKEGNICIQTSPLNPVVDGHEDCLFINVYTPQLPGRKKNTPLFPVMVWIHGGAFTFGSGDRAFQGPDYIVDEGVIVVTLNYRLGAFGFLSLENKEAPGNTGLKDQVLALRWVQQNIAKFGGDPGNVTIFGESSGGSSVHFHMMSPTTEGLFHKAISQSGTGLAPWAYTRSARKVAFNLGLHLGLNTSSDSGLLDFLRGVPAEEIVKISNGNLVPIEERDPLGYSFPFVPTKENVYEDGEEVFLPGDPKELILEGKFQQVPYLTGICSHEGYIIYYVADIAGIKLDFINNDPSELVLPGIHLRNDMATITDIGKKIKSFYFGDNNISNETLQQFVSLTTDFYFRYPAYNTVKLQAAVSTSPVYFYQFNFDGLYGYLKPALGLGGMPGAMHGEELCYLFAAVPLAQMKLPLDSPEVVTSLALVKMWTDFAKTGKPTPDSKLNIQWPPYTNDDHSCLLIDYELGLVKDLDMDRMNFCEELYSLQN